jgi:hypothetical protein
MPITKDNPYDYHEVRLFITNALKKEGFVYSKDYEINQVPNIVDISYGRDVGYSITKHDLGEKIHQISATKIRENM